MKNRYLSTLISSSLSITPIIIIVIILSLIGISPLSGFDFLLLGVGLVVMIFGLSLFQIGASTGLTKVGEYMGSSLSKQPSLFIVILFSLALGALITCAEPSILIVSKQIDIPAFLLIGSIALGVGAFVVIGVLRVIFQRQLKLWYLLFYAIVFMLVCLIAQDPSKQQFLPFIFDAGGVTTGSATVPFILALGAGVAAVRGGKNSTNDSFGLVGMASIGPILTMTLLIMISPSAFGEYVYEVSASASDASVLMNFVNALIPTGITHLGSFIEVFMALAPILLIFFIYETIYIKLPKIKVLKLLVGFALSYVGLVLFLTAVSAVMEPTGRLVGQSLGAYDDWVIILIAFIIGLVTILCEPAVHVLTNQMTDISDGHIKKTTVLLALSLGVGVAICLAAIRALYKFSIMYYVVPGYLISILLMFVCPDIYTAMAFDSGGTASGPMAVSFVLPMIMGITYAREGIDADFYGNSFGVVALIALTPVIAIQILGVTETVKKYQALSIMRRQVLAEDDAQIIHFN